MTNKIEREPETTSQSLNAARSVRQRPGVCFLLKTIQREPHDSDAKHPGSVPTFLAKAVLGGDLIKLLTTSMKVSNQKISKIYQFKYPDYKNGIKQVISELREKNKI